MRIAILGAGAMGCAYGFLLAQGGHDVVLIDTWQDHVEAIRRQGLKVDGADGETWNAELTATGDAAQAGAAAAVLVLVKAFATEAAARSIAGAIAGDTIVVTLQNGIGNDARLAAVLGQDRVVQGSTTVGAELLGPAHVRVAPGTLRGESLTSLGRPAAPGPAARCEQLARGLVASSLPAEVLDDVRAVVWRKLAMAAGVGALCATLGFTVADILGSPPAMALLRQAFDEVLAVAAGEDVHLDAGELWTHMLATYRSIGSHPPSLAVDVARGRPTEIEAQLGEVQRRGAAMGVSTPVSDVLTALIEAKTPAA